MKMLYQPSKQHNYHLRTSLPWALLLGIVLLLAVIKPPMPRIVSSAVVAFSEPFWTLRDSIFLRWNGEHLRTLSADDRSVYIRTLEDELERLRRENATTRSLVVELERLRAAQVYGQDIDVTTPATVLVDLQTGSMDRAIIDRGTNDGVRDRMLVLTPEGIAVGYIERAYARTSSLSLFSSASVSTSVFLQTDTPTRAILVGDGAGTMHMNVTREVQVTQDTLVTLTDAHTSVIGIVVAVHSAPEDAYQTVYVRSPISLFDLRYVLVNNTAVWEPVVDDVVEVDIES